MPGLWPVCSLLPAASQYYGCDGLYILQKTAGISNIDVADCTIREIKSARNAIKSREENVLNYFIDRSTNASAESFNSKLKAFRAQLRGIRDLPFFIFRICKVFG